MPFLGHQPLPPNRYLNGGPAIVFHFREPSAPPPAPRTIAPLDGAPTAEQLDEEGAWAEPRRRLRIRRMMAELKDRIRLEKELGHKIAPRVLDSRWDPPAPGATPEATSSASTVGCPPPRSEFPGPVENAAREPLERTTDGEPAQARSGPEPAGS